MKKLLVVFGILGIALWGCSSSSFDESIDKMIIVRQESNRVILHEIDSFKTLDYSGEFKKISENLTAINSRVNSFILDLDNIPGPERIAAVRDFADKNLNGISYPLGIEVNEDTPLPVLKFVLIDKTNLMFREWQKEGTYRFDTLAPAVVFDKANFGPNDAITGRIYLMAYNTNMKLEITIDGRPIVVKDGAGKFSFVSKRSRELPVSVTLGAASYETSIKF
jgi:hypothetical protein